MVTKLREWVDSAGGPLVMMPRSRAPAWRGVTGDHYEEACQINDFAGVLAREWGDILVLDGEPLPTTWLVRPDGLVIVRWVAANSEAELLEFATRWTPDHRPADERLAIRLLEEPYVIFDSGQPGESMEPLDIHPPAAARTLTSFYVKDEAREISFVLHRFE